MPSEPLLWTVVRLLRWDKPAGRLILMIPALWALVLATRDRPPLGLVLVVVVGTLATSALGCIVNDLWDRRIDARVKRTQGRPLAAKTLTVRVAVVVALLALVCAATAAFYINPERDPLSFGLCVAAVPVILLYPSAKRYFPLPQLVLGLAWGFGVLITWSAATNRLEPSTWLLWGATICWTLGFDIAYALPDREDDRRLGLHSGTILFDRHAPEAVGLFFLATALMLGLLGILMHLGLGFWGAWGVTALGWAWQYSRLRLGSYPPVFEQNVGLGFLLLIGMASGLR